MKDEQVNHLMDIGDSFHFLGDGFRNFMVLIHLGVAGRLTLLSFNFLPRKLGIQALKNFFYKNSI